MKTKSEKPTVAAYRKACQPSGIGLSHYVLVVNTPIHQENDEGGADAA
ncbi:MAG: modified peptide precursor CbpA [Actinomycetota bacterium]|nr:MAG: modified peptide precursor CbpA [Actinomycetota bacterium]